MGSWRLSRESLALGGGVRAASACSGCWLEVGANSGRAEVQGGGSYCGLLLRGFVLG